MKKILFISNIKYPAIKVSRHDIWIRKDFHEWKEYPFKIIVFKKLDKLGKKYGVKSRRGGLELTRDALVSNFKKINKDHISHGFNLISGCEQQKLAVDSGHWPLFRYDPRLLVHGEGMLQMDSAAPKIDLSTYILNENRYRVLEQKDPERFKQLLDLGQAGVVNHYALYEHLARFVIPVKPGERKEDK